jgi:hypothetical protein
MKSALQVENLPHKKRQSLAVRILMQGCIVTSRFSDTLENREGRL